MSTSTFEDPKTLSNLYVSVKLADSMSSVLVRELQNVVDTEQSLIMQKPLKMADYLSLLIVSFITVIINLSSSIPNIKINIVTTKNDVSIECDKTVWRPNKVLLTRLCDKNYAYLPISLLKEWRGAKTIMVNLTIFPFYIAGVIPEIMFSFTRPLVKGGYLPYNISRIIFQTRNKNTAVSNSTLDSVSLEVNDKGTKRRNEEISTDLSS